MIRTLRFGTELRRFFRTKMTSLAIIVAVCIPLLYGALYLWAFWNPYDRLDHVAVALVDEDRAVTASDGSTVTAGHQVTTSLLEAKSLEWHETSADQAKAGLAAGAYYAVVTIPEGFSASVASVSGSAPVSATIEVTYDDANGYTTRTLLASVMRELRSSVSSTLGDTMVEKTLLGLNDVSSGLTTAHDGAVSLATGTTSLASGAQDAAAGAVALSSGAVTLASGADAAASGAAQLSDGAGQLSGKLADAAAGATQLTTGASTLSSGAAQASSGAQQLAVGAGTLASSAGSLSAGSAALVQGLDQASTGASALASASGQVAAGASDVASGNRALASALSATATSGSTTIAALAQLVATLPDSDAQKASLQAQLATLNGSLAGLSTQAGALSAGADTVAAGAAAVAQEAPALSTGISASAAGARQVSSGAAQLSAGAGQLASRSTDLAAGTQEVADGASQLAATMSTLSTGVSQLASGAVTLSSSAATLSSGVASLDSGAKELADGTGDLAAGTRKVADGAVSADAGAASLRDGLKTALDKVPTFDDAASNAAVMSDPVALSSDWSNKASSMGEGYAPYFVGLALYVGALILWMLLRPISKRSLAAPVSALRLVLSGSLPSWILGLAQVAVLFAVLIGGLGLHPAHLVATLAFAVIVSIAFISLQQMVAIWLGPAVARLVVLILLMLQLTSAGGTFPAVTSPLFFRVLHVLLPMTQVVNGFRESLTGDLSTVFATSVTYLVVMIALNVGMATWGAARLRTWTITRLHPDVTL